MDHSYDSQFMTYADRSSRYSAQKIAALLREVLPVRSVLDVGCARGTWLNAWRETGVTEFLGVGGSYVEPATLVIPREHFVAADLSQPIDLQRKFNLVQSLEVAEHIPATAADQFVENIVRHSAGSVLFSAAPPGQGGEFHVNEREYDYWREKFGAHGFQTYDYLRPLIAENKRVSFWYRFNILLYVHDDAATAMPQVIRTTRIPNDRQIADVSPAWFRARKLATRALPYSLQQQLAHLKALRWGRPSAHNQR